MKKIEESINKKELNKVLYLSSRILNILYIVIIIGIVLISTVLLKEWKVFNFILKIFVVISPVIFGFIISWLLDPLVAMLNKKGMKRTFAVILVYAIFIGIIATFLLTMLPILFRQINELANMVPRIIEDASLFLNNIFDDLSKVEGLDITEIRAEVFSSIQEYGKNIMYTLPESFVNVFSSLFSVIGKAALSLLIGFYLLLTFDKSTNFLDKIIPKKHEEETRLLMKVVNNQLHRFVKGTMTSASVLFILNALGFAIIGLKAPILFGLFCGITNVIPYIGPYIGGIPAVIVGFSQGSTVGIIVLLIIIGTQMFESNILTPMIMSKTMKLHRVTIILGLLIFGSQFGIIGMILATPIMSLIKIFAKFIFKKYKLFGMENYDLASEIN